MRPSEGTQLGNRYTLTSRIAVGGMGEVWKGVDSVLGREVAAKILKDEYLSDSTFLARFRAEAQAMGRVARVLTAAPHPQADKLQVLMVDAGGGPLQVVCGAPNARAGLVGVFGSPGATVPARWASTASPIEEVTQKRSPKVATAHSMMCSAGASSSSAPTCCTISRSSATLG